MYFILKYIVAGGMDIEDLIASVIEMANKEVRSGRISERQLARCSGISQPHLHNALHGARAFSPRAVGLLMQAMGVTVPDVIWRLPEQGEWIPIPLLRGRLGPGNEVRFNVFEGFAPFPGSRMAGIVQPVAVRLAPDTVLPHACRADDLVLLDQSHDLRRTVPPGWCWVVAVFGGLRVRYLMAAKGRILAGHEGNAGRPATWEPLPLREGNILDIVRARLVWTGRKMEKEPLGPAGTSGAGY